MSESPRPIGDYGLIGDTRTAALASSDGAIDWMCVPRFDGEPLFGRLIGGPTAGTYRVGPATLDAPVERCYVPNTATLETTWTLGTARLTLAEGMVSDVSGTLLPTTLLVRRISVARGAADVVIQFDPRHGAGRDQPAVTRRRPGRVVCTWGALAVALDSDPQLDITPGVPCTVTVTPTRPLTLVLSVAYREPLVFVPPEAAWRALRADERRWRAWTETMDTDLPDRDAVVRSLVTLRLLTYSPSGAPVAAPTTSLPEDVGGVRNWDYRYAWPRDASIGVGAFLGVGRHHEALQFFGWLRHASRLDRPRLPVLLSLHGKHPRQERRLDDWPGYAGSRPVRVGNAAADQHQLDGYGWVIDAAWLLTRAGHRLDRESWRAVVGFADLVADHWHEPDAGIWENRGEPQHHVHSKLMAWLALDRALRIANTHRIASARRRRWHAQRAAVARDVKARGFNEAKGSYTRTYGSDDLDASLLVLPLLGVEAATSARVATTIDAIATELSAGGPFLYRYTPGDDGLPGSEGAFLPCAFWLVQALARSGRTSDAIERFEELLDHATPLGLYAEEIDPRSKAHLGNFPQALTHSALVQSALAIRDARDGHGEASTPRRTRCSASTVARAPLGTAPARATRLELDDRAHLLCDGWPEDKRR